MMEPQSAQNIMPENIPISPIFVGRRRVCLASLAASAIASVQMASWVFSKIFHSVSGLRRVFFALVGFFAGFEINRVSQGIHASGP